MSKHIRNVLVLLQHRKQIPPPHQRPTSRTPEEWSTYWKAQDQPWRTEPEIDKKRQMYLAKRRLLTPSIEQGIYPFKDEKLSRADIEWLLSTHESGGMCGPVDLSDERQREREGLDLRGADLRQENLRDLPLARVCGGLTVNEWPEATEEQRNMATVHLQGTNLRRANLQQADLRRANLQQAFLNRANLQQASLGEANLQQAFLWRANLQQADLMRANLQQAYLEDANLQHADLTKAQLKGARLEATTLGNEKQVGPRLADCQWGDVNLAVIKWSQVKIPGDEYIAQQKRDSEGKTKEKATRLSEYEAAVRANRQLAVALQAQGLNEVAARFAYRAQVLQKSVLWYQMAQRRVPFRERMQALGAWLFSWFLFLLAGYGYKPIRSVLLYLVIIFGFMGLYLLNAHFIAPHLTWDEALVLSVSSFHGRGFFTQKVTLGDTYARLASIEAVVGLVIEISFIATFTQRFFGK